MTKFALEFDPVSICDLHAKHIDSCLLSMTLTMKSQVLRFFSLWPRFDLTEVDPVPCKGGIKKSSYSCKKFGVFAFGHNAKSYNTCLTFQTRDRDRAA